MSREVKTLGKSNPVGVKLPGVQLRRTDRVKLPAVQLHWANGVKLPKRDVSPTCVSRFSPYGVSGKEACKDTPELVLGTTNMLE
jgi:hypothetical protein